jgi:hypothetical protein
VLGVPVPCTAITTDVELAAVKSPIPTTVNASVWSAPVTRLAPLVMPATIPSSCACEIAPPPTPHVRTYVVAPTPLSDCTPTKLPLLSIAYFL